MTPPDDGPPTANGAPSAGAFDPSIFLKNLKNVGTRIQLVGYALVAVFAFCGGSLLVFDDDVYRLIIVVLGVVACLVLVLVFLHKPASELKEETRDIVDPAKEPEARKTPYDVFISTPMAAFDDPAKVKEHHDLIYKIINALEDECGVKGVFYAGLDIQSPDDFEAPDVSLKKNFIELQRSKLFILIVPGKLSSSIYVEAGMALALRKPSVIFVRNQDDLPFLLQGAAGAGGQANLPLTRVYKYTDVNHLIQISRTAIPDLLKTRR